MPLATVLNGNGIARRVEANSSFDRPAMSTRSSRKAMSVIDSCRGLLWRLPCADDASAGASGSSARENFTLSSATTSGWPSALTRTSTGTASGPAPARDGQVGVARDRVDRQVVDQNLIGARAEQSGDLLIDPFDLERFGVGGLGVAGGDGDDRRRFGVGDKQDAVRPEGQRAHGFEAGLPSFISAVQLAASAP